MAKTDWNLGDTVMPDDMNQIGREINDAAAAAAVAQAKADNHASRHATGGPDEITPEMIGAETPSGAQMKANQAEENAKSYADANFPRVFKLPAGSSTVSYVKIAELITNIGDGSNCLIMYVNGTSDYGKNNPGVDVVQVSTRDSVGLYAYTLIPQGSVDIRYGYINNVSTGKTEIWLRRDPWCQATQIIVAQATNVINLGILHQQNTEPSGIMYVSKVDYVRTEGNYTLNGRMIMAEQKFWFRDGEYVIDFNNSDILGVNCIFFMDPLDQGSPYGEGIFFPKPGTPSYSRNMSDYDWLRVFNGVMYLNSNTVWHSGNAGPFYRGSGSPEGVVTASPGSVYTNTAGGMNTTLWIKRSGTGNTGWFAVA